MGEWHYEVKHGPDNQGDYSWVYASGVMVCVCKTKDAIEIVKACNRPDPADTMKEVVEVLAALNAVVAATGAYLSPDWIDKDECINRILAATDNPRVNAARKFLMEGNDVPAH